MTDEGLLNCRKAEETANGRRMMNDMVSSLMRPDTDVKKGKTKKMDSRGGII